MNEPLTTVFVYGTLMPGERNAHIADLGSPVTVQPATLRGYRLLHLAPEGYPALVTGSPDELASGFALTYTPEGWQLALPHLDELEGLDETPPLYTREQVSLQLSSGSALPAWVYVYARHERLEQPGVSAVPGGDWRTVTGRHERGSDQR